MFICLDLIGMGNMLMLFKLLPMSFGPEDLHTPEQLAAMEREQ
jgi:hypothetical protein